MKLLFFFIKLGNINYFVYICAQILNIVWQIMKKWRH